MKRPDENEILELFEKHGETLVRFAQRRTLAPGETIFREGDVGDEAYVVVKGELVISRKVDGREKAIAVAGPGNIVGEIAPFSGNTRTATVHTNAGATVIVFSSQGIRRLRAEAPDVLIDLYECILRIVTGRLRGAVDQYEVIYHLLKKK